MGKCPGVCQSLITPEEYKKIVQKVAMVFQGRSDELVDSLQVKMDKAVERLDFEAAAKYRDRIKALHNLNADQKVSLPDDTVSRDAIALAADEKHCCIQLFQIRAGKLVGRLGFFADAKSGTAWRNFATGIRRTLLYCRSGRNSYRNIGTARVTPKQKCCPSG